jgi:putative autoinducer-2 (AI-2) aldolase
MALFLVTKGISARVFLLRTTGVDSPGPRCLPGSRMRPAISLAVRTHLGAHFVKTYYVAQGFKTVVASCPVPVVIAGGAKVQELEALTMAHRARQEGAAGVDMGRNILQAEAPAATVQAVRAVAHNGETTAKAYDLYRSLREVGVNEG